jgi:predicted permease
MILHCSRAFFTRFRNLFRSSRKEGELAAELSSHLHLHIDDNLRAGMTPDEARRQALLHLGGLEQTKERVRDQRTLPVLDAFLGDLRFAARLLRKSPAFTLVVVLTLSLGIGASTAIFHLIDAVRLRSLPVSHPQDLVSIQVRGGNHGFGVNAGGPSNLTYPLWQQIHEHQTSLSGVFAWEPWGFEFGHGANAKSISGLWVSGDLFATLGVVPFRGRLIGPEEDRPGCGYPGVVISYAFWQSEFAGQDSAIGQKIIIEDYPVQVLGVTPPSFTGLEVGRTFDIAVPFCSAAGSDPAESNLVRRDYFWLTVMGRLKPDVSLAQASAELEALSPGIIEATMPSGYSNQALNDYRAYVLNAFPAAQGFSRLRETYATSLWLLLGITAMVLLLVCVNVANLMLARSSVRQREMAVRLALGASRWRLARQLLAESLLLAACGALLGVLLASFLSRALVRLITTEGDHLHLDLTLDWRVLVFVAAVATLTSVVFGLAPALRSSRATPGDILKSGGRGSTGGRDSHSFQRLLVVSQIAVSFVLLVSALLFVRSFYNLNKVDPGFRQDGILVAFFDFAKVNLPPERFEPESRDLLTQIRSIPVVDSAAISTHLPFNGSWTSAITVDAVEGHSKFTWVSPGYLQTLQVPLIAGRDFSDRDTATSPRVAIVSQTFVSRYLAGRDPIGKLIRTAPEPHYPAATYEIVGVVKDTKYDSLREQATPPEAYAPASQFPAVGPGVGILMHSSAPLASVIAAVREKVAAISPDVSTDFTVLKRSLEDSLIRERMLALLAGAFGFLAVLLAVIGLYGVVSYTVTLRRAEIGIRMALGASPQNILAIVLRQSLLLLAFGIATGASLALFATRGAASLLYAIQPGDPLTLIGAAIFLALVALIASLIPARRASQVDPLVALRYE